MRRPIVVLALPVALLVAACATSAPNEGVPPEAETTAPLEVTTTLPPVAATEVEPADLASAGEEQPSIAFEASLPSEEIAEKLRMESAGGASDPVLVFGDDFSSPGWLEFTEDEWTTSYVDGAYELSVKPGGFSTAFGLNPSSGPLTDFYFQIETRAYGPADNGYGIRFRDQGAGFYEFIISSGGTGSSGEIIDSGGTFSVDKFVEGTFVRIVPFKTESPSIVQGEGELNVLGVLALGPDISLYINGQEVASFSDPDHPAGGISLRVNPYFEQGSRTLFDNAAVWVPAD
jgi:hypothetical protein